VKYEDPAPLTHDESEAAYASNDPAAIADAIVGAALNDEDWRWVQRWCTTLARHREPNIRRLAAVCLGPVARIHEQLDPNAAAEVLRQLLRDADPDVREGAQFAIDDIAMFLRKRITPTSIENLSALDTPEPSE
jgi:hypothetical protein